MKRAVFLVALALLEVGLATPAAGKGDGRGESSFVGGVATIRGPGLHQAIVVPWRSNCLRDCSWAEYREPFVRLALGSQVVGFLRYVSYQAPDPDRLGPRYTLRFKFRLRGGDEVRIHLQLYPYGPGDLPPYVTTQPWLHVPSRQVGLGEIGLGKPLTPGWYPGSPSLLDLLKGMGLPPKPVEAAEPPEPSVGKATNSVHSLPIALGVGGLLLAVLFFLALVVRQRRIKGA
jgi:hypothetical protein